MARTIQEIKKQMTDAFMADPTIREKYEFKEGDTFSSRFSVVSLESLIFYIVASAHFLLERIFDKYKEDITAQIDSSVVATMPWYHRQALAYQHGDSLVLDDKTLRWQYPKVDEAKRIVRYVAVKDMGGSIRVLASKDKGGIPEPLSEDELRAFKTYLNSIKIAGVILSVRSLPADRLVIKASIQLDPLVFLPNGTRIYDGKKPVEEAITAYLRGITYGGVFNKTKLVDAMQAVEGVVDIELGECSAQPYNSTPQLIKSNNFRSVAGCFIAPDLSQTLNYIY